ncbi:MAG: hypothetical protein RL648_988, partial [Verrucomicrobiota bacterium]
WPEAQVWDEVPIHDIEVEPLDGEVLNPFEAQMEGTVIGGQDGWGKANRMRREDIRVSEAHGLY